MKLTNQSAYNVTQSYYGFKVRPCRPLETNPMTRDSKHRDTMHTFPYHNESQLSNAEHIMAAARAGTTLLAIGRQA